MSQKAKRLATLVQELRGSDSQSQFARKLGVSRPTVAFWESCLAYPESDNLQKIAHLKGWALEDLQTYLIQGELPTEDPLEQILRKMRNLPSEAVIQIVTVGAQTLSERMGDKELSLKA